jgi:outer membrane protein assembly factor BamA
MRAVREKAANLEPERESKVEHLVDRINRSIIETLLANQSGFGMKVGGLMPGSGFAFGPRYRRNDLANESIQFQASLVGSLRRYWAAEARLEMPQIFGSKVDLELGARHSDSPSISYFGSGSGSSRSGRTSYRREDTELRLGLGWRPLGRRWLFGLSASALKLNVGPGRDTRYLSAEQVYGPADAIGIDRQSHYLAGGPYVAYDYRDREGLPHRGGRYMAQMLEFWDRSGGSFSFRRMRFSAEQYFPFLNEKRVIALRACTDLSFTRAGEAVPFYMQPTIGGPDDVRGLDRFRYQANNATVLNAEYRWEVAPTLDMALFADAGNVFARPGLIGFRYMKTAAGIGFRVKTRDSVVVRMDAGASKEGFRLWVTFGNIF